MKNKIFIGSLIYGIVIGFLSVWWRNYGGDTLFLFNIPGEILGDEVYNCAISCFGDPSSSQAHYTIPWILRIPQVYVPISIFFWGLGGLMIQLVYRRFKKYKK